MTHPLEFESKQIPRFRSPRSGPIATRGPRWLVLLTTIALALSATSCDDGDDADDESEEEHAGDAVEGDATEGDIAQPANASDVLEAPAEPEPPPLPPLHTLTPAERLIVLASDPVPWSEVGELGVSLYNARLNLHRLDGGGPVFDLGHAATSKYVQGRWKAPWMAGELVSEEQAKLDEVPELANRRVVWNEGSAGSLRFPLPADIDQNTDYTLLVRLRPKVNRRLVIWVNGAETGGADLSGAWETVQVKIPAKSLKFGQENTIRMSFGGSFFVDGLGQARVACKFDWVRLLPTSEVENYSAVPPLEDLAVEDAHILDTRYRSLGIPAGTRLDGYFVIPAHGRFRAFLAPAPISQSPIPFKITIQTDKLEEPVALFDAELDPGSPWKPVEFDLSDYVGQAARFSFSVDRGEAGSRPDDPAVWLGEPAIVIVRPHDEIGQGPKTGDDVEPIVPERVIILAIDALRADRVAPQPGVDHPATPNISRLAREGVRMEMIASGTGSIAPTVSLLSGTYPARHGIADTTAHLRESFVTIGDLFDEAGWETGMLSTDPYVSNERGFAQGFDRYRNLVEEQGKATSSRLIEAAVRVVKKQTTRSRILYVQVGGLRLPHMPGAEALTKFHSGGYVGNVTVETMMDPRRIPIPLGTEDKRYLEAAYNGELFEIDALIGDLLKALEETGDITKTLVVVAGVHGEPLGEDAQLGYSNRPTDAELRVPLVIYWPARFSGGRRPRQLAESVDVLPTIAKLSGLEIPDSSQGRSLVRVLDGRRDNSAAAGFGIRTDSHQGVVIDQYNYVLRTGDNDLLFYRGEGAVEPREDQSETMPIAKRAMRDAIALHLAFANGLWRKPDYGTPVTPKKSFVSAALERGW